MDNVFRRRILRLWAKKNDIPMDQAEWFNNTALFNGFLLNFELARFIKVVAREILGNKNRLKW